MIKGGNDVLLDTAAIVAGAGLVALPFVFLVPLPAPASWPYILASVATHVAYYYLMINAYRSGELKVSTGAPGAPDRVSVRPSGDSFQVVICIRDDR